MAEQPTVLPKSGTYGLGQLMQYYGGKLSQSELITESTVQYYQYLLAEMCMNTYTYIDMPDSINVRWMEYQLLHNALACIVPFGASRTLAVLRATMEGSFDAMHEPVSYTLYGDNGYSEILKSYKPYRKQQGRCAVPVWANRSRIPLIIYVREFARRLADIDMAIDTNIQAQKMPVILECSEEQKKDFLNLESMRAANQPFMMVSDKLGLSERVSYYSPNVPFVAKDLTDVKNTIFNQAMTFLGIANTNMDKKERMVTDEVAGNHEQVAANRLAGLNARRMAMNTVNKLYGTNISVVYSKDIDTDIYYHDIAARHGMDDAYGED